MNKSQQIRFRSLMLLLLFICLGVSAQKQSKTFKETFNVGDDAVIDINTSYADIEFETWDKNEVVVEAIIELEGATEEEAEEYFSKGPVEIFGNSKSIEIRTSRENSWSFRNSYDFDWDDNFVIEIPEFPEIEPLFLDIEIPDLPEFGTLLEMPPMPFIQFDYNAYQEDGEKYIKEWQEEFSKEYGEEYKQRMKEWAERMKERAEEWEARKAEREESRKERLEERNRLREEAREAREKVREERDKLRSERERLREEKRDVRKSVIISRSGNHSPNIFYRWSDDDDKTTR